MAMRRVLFFYLLATTSLVAAERRFDFGEVKENQTPPGFRSAVNGVGRPGDWKVILADVPPILEPLTPNAPSMAKKPVLAQLSQDPSDEHFPVLIFEDEVFDDFTLTTRFKTVSGEKERMAGIAFRVQNETNYYVLRASSLGNTFRFYKVVNGERGNVIGPDTPIPSGTWHEMTIECKANQIRCLLDGKQLIPTLTDNTFASGKIAFWTKSDSVSYFADTRISYAPREIPAQAIVRDLVTKYSRLLDLKVYVLGSDTNTTRVIGSKDEMLIGQAGGKPEHDVITQSSTYYGKDRQSVAVTMPVRDRNGDTIAAARVVMRSFPGQTEDTAVTRARPIVKELQGRIQSLQDLQ
jgi:hypothetical protein